MFAKYLFFIYRKSGERTGITYPDGRTVSYGYDEQVRLSEMREGDRVITYGYDAFGRLSEKKFPNGTESAYTYDSKGQLTELVHRDREGVSDRYTYLYDLTGNKTGITKERRGLETESGAYAYGYDALGRLSQIPKDGKLQIRYGYDAFGNRVLKEDRAGRTTYCHNALNQLITEIREGADPVNKSFAYDKRGNLTRITENGQMTQQYVYGALNRLEEAVNGAGKAAKYQYNGLGHRVGKAEGTLSKGPLEGLDPRNGIKAGTEIGNWNQIRYTIDLTREYHNLLEKTEGEKRQTYFWDGNVTSYEENGRQSYYLQDELGSPIRIEDETGEVRESYGYGAFGEDLYGNQGEIQPFGYTGYQRDKVAGTYYAQTREYQAKTGRFIGQDEMWGFMERTYTLNRYIYCFNKPVNLVDLNGAWPQWMEDIGENISTTWNKFADGVSHIWNEYIYGEDITITATTPQSGIVGVYTTQTITKHRGGNIIVANIQNGNKVGISFNIPSIKISDDTSIGIPTSLGINWAGEDSGVMASAGIEVKIKGAGVKSNVNVAMNTSDWVSVGSEIGYIYKNQTHGVGVRAALNPMSTWNLHIFNTLIQGNIKYNLEIGAYVQAFIPELVVLLVAAVFFPAAIPVMVKVFTIAGQLSVQECGI